MSRRTGGARTDACVVKQRPGDQSWSGPPLKGCRMSFAHAIIGALLFAVIPAAAESGEPVQGASKTCGPVAGATARDVENVMAFCRQMVPASDGHVIEAGAINTWLIIGVDRGMAEVLRDPLTAETLARAWMNAWRVHCGEHAARLRVAWRDVEIINARTAWFGGEDVVEIIR